MIIFHTDYTEATEGRIAALAAGGCTSGMLTLDEVDKHGRKRRALCEICEICVR